MHGSKFGPKYILLYTLHLYLNLKYWTIMWYIRISQRKDI